MSQETCRRLVALALAQGMAAARWTPSERRTSGWGRIGRRASVAPGVRPMPAADRMWTARPRPDVVWRRRGM